ncbi:integrase [Aeromonas sp. RU39B]|uniref:site-specific integrase n=1 Tax=Aeromonas sp. RU39B TaxID=1907416 RepID=UPI000955C3AC|nr:site-specific integrase [Aeromonas sp. RU39B]SIR65466.1 integrase [Aeromonas sp. RU39B]
MGTEKQLPRGVTLRGDTINITFTYRGVRCREPLSNLPSTPANIRYAARLLAEIQGKIERDQFYYADQFPKSSKLKLFGSGSRAARVVDYLDEYLARCERRGISPSTIVGYRKCKSSLSSMHQVLITDLTPAILKTWLSETSTTAKTARNRLSFLRSAIDEAVTDGLLAANPVSLVTVARYLDVDSVPDRGAKDVDPFTPEEVSAILSTASGINEQWANLFRFAFATGMRPSEVCALRWGSIDWIGNTVKVSSAKVVGVIKSTKTRAGNRTIELTSDAIAALTSQKRFTFMRGEYVFEDPKLNKPWAGTDAIRKKAWIYTLRRSGVRYRHLYQTRHTFATANISRGCNLFWLATQMGHKGPEMLFRHYGSYLAEYDGQTSKAPLVIQK